MYHNHTLLSSLISDSLFGLAPSGIKILYTNLDFFFCTERELINHFNCDVILLRVLDLNKLTILEGGRLGNNAALFTETLYWLVGDTNRWIYTKRALKLLLWTDGGQA